MTTSVENPNVGSLGGLDRGDVERDIEQIVIENQQRAKELTEKAAAENDPIEREALLRQALDHEVQARIQSETPQELSVEIPPGGFDQDESGLAEEIGMEAMAGPLLDMTSPIVLKEALEELEGGLNADAFGGYFVNIEDENVSNATSPSGASPAAAVSLERALPPIEEILEEALASAKVEGIQADIGTAPRVDSAEASVETTNAPQTPVNVNKSDLIADVSIADAEVGVVAPASGQVLETTDTTEVTITKTEVVDTDSPTRKPRKLEIKSRKKPRKLEIRSQQSP